MFDVSSKGRVQVHRVDTWEEKYAYLLEKDTAARFTSGTVHFSAPEENWKKHLRAADSRGP